MQIVPFDTVLDEVMMLEPEQREMLIEIVRNRQIELRREELLHDIEEGLSAFNSGELKPQTVDEIMKEAIEPAV